MKSKITKIQILKKGIAFILIIVLSFSTLSVFQTVLAEDGIGEEAEEVIDYNEDLVSEESEAIKSLSKNIDDLIKQIEEINSAFNYNAFFNTIKNNNTIYISNESELRALNVYIEKGNTCEDKKFILKNNIVLTDNIQWSPIGSTDYPFKGTLDGAGFTISGMLINEKQSYAGLIGYLGENGVVKNLTISQSKINIPPEVDNVNSNDLVSKTSVGYSYLGAIVGYAKNATISNCKNTTDVSGGNYVGGIVGWATDCKIDNCSNSGYIKGFKGAGGIVGYFKSSEQLTSVSTTYEYSIERCKNTGSIYGIIGNAGGIAGALCGQAKIESSYNYGTIAISDVIVNLPYHADTTLTYTPQNAGGLVGWASGLSGYNGTTALIKGCITEESAKVSGYQDIGGIVGQLGGDSTGYGKAENCIDYSNNISCTLYINGLGLSAGKIAGAVGVAEGKKYTSTYVSATGTKSIGIIKNCYYIANKEDATSDDQSVKNKVMGYGYSENRVENGKINPKIDTSETSENSMFKLIKENDNYKYQEKSGENNFISVDETIAKGFEYKSGSDGKLYVDNTSPTISTVSISNSGAPTLAKVGDILTINIPFNEKINLNRTQPQLTLFSDKYATFVGIGEDSKSLIFEYTLDGTESGKVGNLKLTANILDIFGNSNTISSSQKLEVDTGKDILAIASNSETVVVLTNNEYNIAYKIEAPHLSSINGRLYFNKTDTIKITAIFGGKLTSAITTSEIPKINVKIGNMNYPIESTADKVDNDDGTIVYEFSTGNYNGQLTEVYLEQTTSEITYGPKDNEKTNKLGTNTKVNFSEYNIFVDTNKPTLEIEANPSIVNKNNRYTTGEEILITAKTSEPIELTNSRPQINVSFSESGLGKYNYQGEKATTGNAIYIETVANKNATSGEVEYYTYKYKYIIQNGDEGNIQLSYASNTNITDIAGNTTTYTTEETKITSNSIYADTTAPTVKITTNNSDITNEDKATYTFTWSEEVKDFTPDDITVNGGNKGTLSDCKDNEDGTYSYTMDITNSVPKGNVGELQIIIEQNAVQDLVGNGNVRAEKVITVDKKAPTVEITADKEYVSVGETITYTFNWSERVKEFKPENIEVENAEIVTEGEGEEAKAKFEKINDAQYTLKVRSTNGNDVEVIIEDSVCTDAAGNSNIGNKHNIAVLPTVEIIANILKYDFNEDGRVNNEDAQLIQDYKAHLIKEDEYENYEDIVRNILQNGDVNKDGDITIKDAATLQLIISHLYKDDEDSNIDVTDYYTFVWSEEVVGFTEDSITVNGGIKGELLFAENNVYVMKITPNVSDGSVGELQVIVEQNAVQDLNGNGNVRAEKVITVDKQAPTVEIKASQEYVSKGEKITYTFNWSEAVAGFIADDIEVNNAEIVTEGEGEEKKPKFEKINDTQYTLEVTPINGNDVEVIIKDGVCTDIAGNGNIGNKHTIAVVPTVTIIAKKYKEMGNAQSDITNNITNADKIIYTFVWSEEVTGFTVADIIVNGGEKLNFGKNENGNYYVEVSTHVTKGNIGSIQVIVEQNAVQDLNGNGNVRAESVINIDKQAPILISLEAYADSNISVDSDVDSVKEYYQAGDEITVVATFSENIEGTTTAPTLALQFSESGNAKGTVSKGTINGNKITYTYTITKGDNGQLSVKGFSGAVIDVAENETIVTKRNLDGDTIIADTVAPELIGLTAIAPDFEYDELLEDPGDTKRYGVTSKTRENNTITIIAEYSENVYNLKYETKTVNNITEDIAPTLSLFHSEMTRIAEVDKVEGNKIYYTYDIASGDDGNLHISGLNGFVCDIAGNPCHTSTGLPTLVKYEESISEENKVENITADTTKPIYTISTTAENKDDNENRIQGNTENHVGYYRKGSIITITAKTNEYVYKNNNNELTKFAEDGSDAPELNISFTTSGTGTGKRTCTNVEYKDNKTIFTYTYTIKENDNGTLILNIDEAQGYDIALNGNDATTQTIDGTTYNTRNHCRHCKSSN